MASNSKKKKNKGSSLPNQAVSAYTKSADPLGSYTGVISGTVFPGKNMPRHEVNGKVYMKVDEKPVQDADDL